MTNQRQSDFWTQVAIDKAIVLTWPEWMQKIVITAESASTGKFIKDSQ